MREESFPVNEKLAQTLGDICARQLGSENAGEGKTIYINLSMVRLQTCFVLPKLIYAKGLAKESGAKVVAITWRPNSRWKKMVGSMGIDCLFLEEMLKSDIPSAFKSMVKTAGLVLGNASGEKLKEFKAMGLPVGGPLYEDIIRSSDLSTLRTVRNKTAIRKILHILWMLYSLERYIKNHPPLFFIADDLAYHEGAMIMLFKKYGASVYNSSWEAEELIETDANGRIIRRGEMANKWLKEKYAQYGNSVAEKADQMIKDRFAGKSGRDIDRQAFKGKKVLSREEMQEYLGLDKEKKNVVIMAHTFTDAVFNYGDIYFRDYYDWLEKTLKTAEDVKNVNWILKPHPSRKLYHESADSIEDMFARHKKDHLFMLDDSISAESIRNIADVLVTIGGNAGGEFACVGIPSVIAGKTYYSGFDFTKEPRDYNEYEKQLRDIADIAPLTEKQTDTAKSVFYLRFTDQYNEYKYLDEFALYVRGLYDKFSEEVRRKLFESDNGTENMNNAITEDVIKYAKEHDLSGCEYYLRGVRRGKQRALQTP
ncbi:MAG: hypothetical protein IKR23_09705 [Lachnospiraceae bacterium]|nr:hypothetical protein [Lachnospiraceae bacterium]